MTDPTPTDYVNTETKLHLTLNDEQTRLASEINSQLYDIDFGILRSDFETPGPEIQGILLVSEDYSLPEVAAVIVTKNDLNSLFWSFIEERIITIIGNTDDVFPNYPKVTDFPFIDGDSIFNVLFRPPIYIIQKKSG